MKVCCITGIPFYDHSDIVVIPVIVREKKVMQCVANDNVHPLPIAFHAKFGLNDFTPIKDERFDKAVKAISSLVGTPTTWDDFELFESNKKRIIYGNNHEYSFGLFICHKYAFDNVIQNFKVQTGYTNPPEPFLVYKDSVRASIENDGVYKLACGLMNPVPYVNRLPVSIVSDYALPYDFSEEDLDHYSEIRMLDYFMNMTGKQWTVSADAPEEKQTLAMSILIDSINVVANP